MSSINQQPATSNQQLLPFVFSPLLTALGPFETHPHLAVAVSGGADSMALLLLADGWARIQGGKVIALTVDHGLRKESAAEAAQVKAWCEARDIAHHTLRVQDSGFRFQASGIQAQARDVRYALLTEWCKANQVPHLLTAHHRDDQAETLFFRLARGSGLDGLACMAPVKMLDGIRLLRPLLSVPKSELMAYLQSMKQPWIDDPSNENPSYTRNRIRAALVQADDYAEISARAYAVTEKLAKFRGRLQTNLEAKLATHVRMNGAEASIDAQGFIQLEPEYGRRILAHIIQTLGQHEHKPRTHKLERLYTEITAGNMMHPRALGGCVFHPPAQGKMVVRRAG